MTDNNALAQELEGIAHSGVIKLGFWTFTNRTAIYDALRTPAPAPAPAPVGGDEPVAWMHIIREWFGGERYARDYEYLDANYGEQARRVADFLNKRASAALKSPPAPEQEDVVEKMAIAMAPASFDVFDPKVHGSIVNQLATQKMWREKARKAYAAIAAMPPKVEAPAADEVRRVVGLMETCAQESELGRNWPSTPEACRKAANLLERLSHPTADAVAVEQSPAARDVVAERQRQIENEGWTPEHDDEHGKGELLDAALCYAQRRSDARMFQFAAEDQPAPARWPWDIAWWKPKDERRDLVRAAALILAEIERLDRAAIRSGGAS